MDGGASGIRDHEGRGAVLSGGVINEFAGALANSADVAILSSCGPDQSGHEFDDLSHGVFTSKLLESIEGPADINADKVVSVMELVTYLEWPVERYVRDNTVGQSQKPAVVCDAETAGAGLVKIK